MSRLGQRLIRDAKRLLTDIRAGKPMEQRIVRRMKVKGKTVYVHDRFTAPIVPRPSGGEGMG